MDRLSHSAIIDRRQPGSVYSTTIMRQNDGVEKVLMVSQDKSNVITLRSVLVNDEYETSVVPLNFPNIPGEWPLRKRFIKWRERAFFHKNGGGGGGRVKDNLIEERLNMYVLYTFLCVPKGYWVYLIHLRVWHDRGPFYRWRGGLDYSLHQPIQGVWPVCHWIVVCDWCTYSVIA